MASRGLEQMKDTSSKVVEIPFTVSARTARLIGQENFANAEGAIIELVKNSYDADSTMSLIIINSVTNTIHIFDNGEGMTEDIIRKHWMTIGTEDKKNNIKSKQDRIKTGAKGIGRFALDRLGRKCKMISKTSESECLFWEVDWGQFDNKDALISDIKAQMHQMEGFYLPHEVLRTLKLFELDTKIIEYWKNNAGTLIEISELRDDWSEKSIDSLYSNLELLVPPIDTNIFSVCLFDTTLLQKYGMVQSAICDDYDYKVTASVCENKKVNIKVTRNELNLNDLKRIGFFENTTLSQKQYQIESFENGFFEIESNLESFVPGFKPIDKNNNLEKIGAFSFSFYFMKRGGGQEKDEEIGKFPYKLVNFSLRKNWLDKFGGIKIFRDNFRVRPYGEPKSTSFDWLNLGNRALSSPTVTKPGYRVRPQQIYGIINISRIGNIKFEDKSSREGLQENDTFTLFKEIIKAIIEIFENDRNQIMMSLKSIYDVKNQKEKTKQEADEKAKNKKSKSDDEKLYIDAIEAYKEEITDLKDEQKLLRVLASAGLIVTSFAHELKNLSDSIVPRTEDLKSVLLDLIDSNKIKDFPDYLDPYVMLDDIRAQDVRLKTWLDFALASVRKDKRTRKLIDIGKYIEGLERTWSSLLSRRKVKLIIDKTEPATVNLKCFEIDLDGIFNNLIANSVDAFKRHDAKDRREIKISLKYNITEINILYEDTGPGLEEEIIDPNQIFQPFFTTKRDDRTGEKIGTGLGMWIVKSSIDEYNGKIEFINVRDGGFALKIIFPH